MQIHENLKMIRTNRHETQQEIADILNTTQQQYWKYEKGLQEFPARHVITLAEHYNISTDELLGIKKSKYTLSGKEKEILSKYRKLDEVYKEKIEERMETFIDIQEETAKQKEIA